MKIEILVPFFKCEEDENIFFSRISSLLGYDRVVVKGKYLYLTLKDDSGNLALDQVQEISDFWGITYKVLE
ncbi:hypothetical protein [Marinobacter confluentis]|uniref:Uncharacterized protein n=1 Tax=Marinobacter confluentis TaxID=1697557 RepID=A0A4Z1C5P7_9GAMM|nr:hypothetical protein [Marinobacter confluentis]TGN41831.1 hypothetical protein E5Q11_04735 [Marinobacter confluentis]